MAATNSLSVVLVIIFSLHFGVESLEDGICKKFSHPYDKGEFYEYFSEFVEEPRSTKSTAEFCNENETSVPNDIDVIKSLATNLENFMKDVNSNIVGLKKAVDISRCPVGKGYFKTSFGCFWVSTEEMNHEHAKQHCLSLGMDLASLEHLQNQHELDKLSKELNIKYASGWYTIGLEKEAFANQWFWSTGTEMYRGSPLWESGQPEDKIGDNWGFFKVQVGVADYGNDVEPFICSLPQNNKTWSV